MTRCARGTEVDAVFGRQFARERNARRLSYHNDFSAFVGDPAQNPFRNSITNRGRPPGEFLPTSGGKSSDVAKLRRYRCASGWLAIVALLGNVLTAYVPAKAGADRR